MIEQFTYELFAGRLGETFTITHRSSGVLAVTLIEAVDLAARSIDRAGTIAVSPYSDNFSIVFRGPSAPVLSQGTYQFEHDQLGRFPLFIVPIGAGSDGIRYEAVFNRMKAAPTP